MGSGPNQGSGSGPQGPQPNTKPSEKSSERIQGPETGKRVKPNGIKETAQTQQQPVNGSGRVGGGVNQSIQQQPSTNGGNNKGAAAKSLTKKQLQEFDKVNPPQMDEYKNNHKSERVGAPNQSQSQTQPPKRKNGQVQQQQQLDPFDELSESGREACQQLLKIYKRAKDAVCPLSQRKIGTLII